eukprot:jgi/Mesvir1/3745/Mv15020-RA.2
MSQASIFEPILAALPGITDDKGNVLSNPFLSTCGYVIPVIDQLGTALYPVKSDIGGNIDRLRKRYETDTARFHVIFAIVEDEIKAGTASGSSSCSNGLLWLKRANQFIVAFLVQLRANPSQSLKDAAYAAYEATLSKYHNWLTRKAFEVGGCGAIDPLKSPGKQVGVGGQVPPLDYAQGVTGGRVFWGGGP